MRKLIMVAVGVLVLSMSAVRAAGARFDPTHHAGPIDTNETWHPSGNPHVIDSDVSTGAGVTLTILPGCVVRFTSGTRMLVGQSGPGAVVAVGTPDSTIRFTSDASVPGPGDWNNICVLDSAMATTRFSYCTFEYGGQGAVWPGGFFVNGTGKLKMDHCTMRQSAGYGVCCQVGSGLALFTDNTITENANYPISIGAQSVGLLGEGNVLTGNAAGFDGILVQIEDVKTTTTWLNHGVPYVVSGDVNVGGAGSPVLTIAPGCSIKLRDDVYFYCGYTHPGAIKADGTAGQIVFTSALSSPGPGDWDFLGFFEHTTAQAQLKHCKIEYGGGMQDWGMVYIGNTDYPVMADDSIGHSREWGIYLDGSPHPDADTLRAYNVFYDCARGAIRDPEAWVDDRSPHLALRREESGTILGRVLQIPENSGSERVSSILLKACGREVLRLHSGANDVSRLAPGVYFVAEQPQATSFKPQAVQKVIITK